MPMSFPNLDSLKRRAEQRGFRQPLSAENERQYREAFADWMMDVDRVESAEIRTGKGWDEQQSDPRAMLLAMGIDVDAMETDWAAENALTERQGATYRASEEGDNLTGVELLPHQQEVLNSMLRPGIMHLEPQSGKTHAEGRTFRRRPATVGDFKQVRDVLVDRVKSSMNQPRQKTAMELAFESAKQKGK